MMDKRKNEIKVDKRSNEIVYIKNNTKNVSKVQFSVREGCNKYKIRIEVPFISLKKDEVCEFEIFSNHYVQWK